MSGQWDIYATHLPVLAAVVDNSQGPVLEHGVGYYSTPLLHALCAGTERRIVSVNGDPLWFERFRNYARPWHEFRLAAMPEDAPDLLDVEWGAVLIDGACLERAPWLKALWAADRARFIVVHDTEIPTSYDYTPVLSKFSYRYDAKMRVPWTSVVSRHATVQWLERCL